MTNIIKFLPPMTFNRNFIANFVEQPAPCAALGIIETAGKQKGFLAFKPDVVFDDAVVQNGFDLGTELLGNDKFSILHLILNFENQHVYDVLLNLNAPVVKQVLKIWETTGDHFFFAFRDNGFTAFDQTLQPAWYEHNYFGMMENATNTTEEYETMVNSFKNSDMMHGKYIDLVFQDKIEFMDLSAEKFEVKSRT